MNNRRRRRTTRRRNGGRSSERRCSEGSDVKARRKKRMRDLLKAIMFMKIHGFHGAGVIGGVSREEGGATDGVRPPAVWDDARGVALRDNARLGAAP